MTPEENPESTSTFLLLVLHKKNPSTEVVQETENSSAWNHISYI